MKTLAAGRDAILQAAAETFRSKGFDRATMEELATRLGFLKASLYYYFKSKYDILYEILHSSRQELLGRLEEVAASDQPPLDKLRQAIVAFVTAFDYQYPALSVAVYERLDRGVPAIDEMQAIRRRVQQLWDQMIREAVEAGAIRSDLDLRVVSFGIIGMCNWLSQWYDKDGRLPSDEIARVFVEMILNGLATEPSQSEPASAASEGAGDSG
jgi:AcrR family transcriptional regulator